MLHSAAFYQFYIFDAANTNLYLEHITEGQVVSVRQFLPSVHHVILACLLQKGGCQGILFMFYRTGVTAAPESSIPGRCSIPGVPQRRCSAFSG